MEREHTPFVKPVFRGARFEGHAVPVEVLPELAAYQDLVVALARHLFLTRVSDRKRVPKGFFESFRLVLTRIDEGSTIPVLERVASDVNGMPLPFYMPGDSFEEARDTIEATIAAAANRTPLPQSFPPALLSRFNHLGRSLRKDESIEFRAPGRDAGARFDREVRKRLVLQKETSYEDDVDQTGELLGGHSAREQLYLRLDDGREIEVPAPVSTVRKLLASVGKRIHVTGVGLYNREERLERLLRVTDISLLDEEGGEEDATTGVPSPGGPSSIDAQIDDLQALELGWYEPDTPALDREGLNELRRVLRTLLEGSGLPTPYLYPTPEARVRAEWSLGDWDVSATFLIPGEAAELHAAHLESEAMEEETLLLDSPHALQELRGWLQRFGARRSTS